METPCISFIFQLVITGGLQTYNYSSVLILGEVCHKCIPHPFPQVIATLFVPGQNAFTIVTSTPKPGMRLLLSSPMIMDVDVHISVLSLIVDEPINDVISLENSTAML